MGGHVQTTPVKQTLHASFADTLPEVSIAHDQKTHSIAIASGKGGVGKTLIAASIGYHISLRNKRVTLIDCDLGSPSLHKFFNLQRPQKTLKEIILNPDVNLNDLTYHTEIENLKVICGSSDTLGVTEKADLVITKLIKSVQQLRSDFVIFDLGSGINDYDVKLFLSAGKGILVGTPEPTSILENFNFLKQCVLQKLEMTVRDNAQLLKIIKNAYLNFDAKKSKQIKSIIQGLNEYKPSLVKNNLFQFQPGFILNMVSDEPSDFPYALSLETALSDILGVQLKQWGAISFSAGMRDSMMNSSYLDILINSNDAKEFYQYLSGELIQAAKSQHRSDDKFFTKKYNPRKIKFNKFSNTLICSSNCGLWNKCDHQRGGYPCKIKYIGFINTN